jgi:hypothetical protein
MQHPIAARPLAVDGLLAYLAACGGSDVYRLWDSHGIADVPAARALAEKLRATLGDQLGVIASVEQSFNKVTLTALEPARV